MPDTIVLDIEPVRIEVSLSHQWNTTITQYGGGYEQRSSFVDKKLAGPSSLTFNEGIEDAGIPRLKAFFDARKGMAESFTTPSWIEDARLFSAVAPAATEITLVSSAAGERFSYTALNEGNLAVIGKKVNGIWTLEPTHVTSVSIGTSLTTLIISPATVVGFSANDYMFVGYHVRFGTDVLGEKVTAGVAHEYINVPIIPVFA